MSEIAHAMGYLSGALGIGFALAFGAFAGIKAASWAFGPFKVDMNIPSITLKSNSD